jgi:hypothetical protein
MFIFPLVVILVVHENGVLAFKGESQSPVAAYAHGPVAFEVTLERMPVPAAPVHVERSRSEIQGGQQNAKPGFMFRLNARL